MPRKTEQNDAPIPGHVTPQFAGEPGLSALSWVGTAWIEAMSDLGTELASFVADRIKEDVKTQHEILNCKTVGEMQAIQAAFMERAFVQYTVETGRLIEKGTSLFPQLPGQTKHTPV